MRTQPIIASALAFGLIAAACSSDSSNSADTPTASELTATESAPPAADPTDPELTTDQPDTDQPDTDQPVEPFTTITLVTYDSFPEADTSINAALDAFTDQTAIGVELLVAGDTGTMLSKAALTVGNPEGDVMWGIDNTFLSRALNDGIFEQGVLFDPENVPAEFLALVPNGEALPVDFGDVCVNYDIGYFAENELDVPTSLQDLADPAYRDLLVVQNPATSSPGLAFLLASIDEFGAEGWQAYWQQLKDNGVLVVDGWTDAYYGSFTWAGGGDRPLVVSYGSSPPAEVIFADPPRDDAPTGVIESTCFRQIEFAGVLAGTDHPDEAAELVRFLGSEQFQAELALNLFVYPANSAVALPQEFDDFAVVPDTSRTLDPDLIDENRSDWIDEWSTLVLG
ncbi:MAG: thiamine ABC transporter substrate-binding protein [Ilumatobacter sp.]|jgi:thiamine transport system substrate-binding protein|uniref:thiamine ABC transporter substrate-binding protein n=1 Tax=uncultured Ilumatobacter sp. TaxID=879968 RepID=UPI003591148C|tara:strand:+ start:99 stop:1289 length:1191 start_codon:yes stop_codon:yes gene_type:complete